MRRATGELPLAALTAAHDLAGVLISPSDPWQFTGVLALVENIELFMHVEAVVPAIDAALWTAGRCDRRLLDWIASMPGVSVVHVGHYDPVGLDEYLRVRTALPEGRVALFVPADLEERLMKYGKSDLLLKSLPVLERVRRDAPEEVQRVLDVIDRHGKGLEQEALLIAAGPGTLADGQPCCGASSSRCGSKATKCAKKCSAQRFDVLPPGVLVRRGPPGTPH